MRAAQQSTDARRRRARKRARARDAQRAQRRNTDRQRDGGARALSLYNGARGVRWRQPALPLYYCSDGAARRSWRRRRSNGGGNGGEFRARRWRQLSLTANGVTDGIPMAATLAAGRLHHRLCCSGRAYARARCALARARAGGAAAARHHHLPLPCAAARPSWRRRGGSWRPAAAARRYSTSGGVTGYFYLLPTTQ